jgi:flagellar motor switch/type III secretory pathway protein FliN
VSDIRVPVSVLLAERAFPLEQILELRPGTVLEMRTRHGDPLAFHVNGSEVGLGRAVDVGERLGFRVEALKAPAGDPADTAEG